ncbi:MAG: TIGR00730 family Rossman fold protein [Proteobacteria bacterium]|nr:TIGR00730 family Rossman fold protein [Pseudomonadota bacterium]
MSADPRSTGSRTRAVPCPPARDRMRPLPWHHPKSGEDDADAPERVRRLLESPSYRQADEDPALLQLPEMRGVRLDLDYAKAERLLERHGIRRTIVVFGSTRIAESAAAQRRLRDARARLAEAPDDPDARREAAIAGRIAAKSTYYEVARDLGRMVGEACRGGDPHDLVVMTGAGPGIMEAANRGAFETGADSIGLNVKLPHPQYPNPYLTPDLCFRFHYFAVRKLHFVQRARALVVFPGGYGTLDELFEALALVQTRTIAPVPIVLVGEHYWKRAIDFEFLVDEGTIDPEDLALFWYAETAQEIWDGIRAWHAHPDRPPEPIANISSVAP